MCKLCSSCGAELADDVLFCKYCGAEQKEQEESPAELCIDPAVQKITKKKKHKIQFVVWICVLGCLIPIISFCFVMLVAQRSDVPFFGIDPGDSAFMVKMILGKPDEIDVESDLYDSIYTYSDVKICGCNGFTKVYIADGKVDNLQWSCSAALDLDEEYNALVEFFTNEYGKPYKTDKTTTNDGFSTMVYWSQHYDELMMTCYISDSISMIAISKNRN